MPKLTIFIDDQLAIRQIAAYLQRRYVDLEFEVKSLLALKLIPDFEVAVFFLDRFSGDKQLLPLLLDCRHVERCLVVLNQSDYKSNWNQINCCLSSTSKFFMDLDNFLAKFI